MYNSIGKAFCCTRVCNYLNVHLVITLLSLYAVGADIDLSEFINILWNERCLFTNGVMGLMGKICQLLSCCGSPNWVCKKRSAYRLKPKRDQSLKLLLFSFEKLIIWSIHTNRTHKSDPSTQTGRKHQNTRQNIFNFKTNHSNPLDWMTLLIV